MGERKRRQGMLVMDRLYGARGIFVHHPTIDGQQTFPISHPNVSSSANQRRRAESQLRASTQNSEFRVYYLAASRAYIAILTVSAL